MSARSLATAAFHRADFYAGDPHPVFAALRREAPVHWHAYDETGFWVIAKWADVRALSRDHEGFTSTRGTLINDLNPNLGLVAGDAIHMEGTPPITRSDPPQHTKLRNLTSKAFSPRIVARLEDWTRATCRAHLAAIEPGRPSDFIQLCSGPIPIHVIAKMLGLPEEDWPRIKAWTDDVFAVTGDVDTIEILRLQSDLAECWRYLAEHLERRRSAPRDDLLTALIEARVDGERLSLPEAVTLAQGLLAAGNDTTRTLLSGSVLALIEHPEQRARLVREPALIPNAIEELLRWVSPVHGMCRVATRDVELRGRTIRKGDAVLLLYSSANRDEEVWPDASRLDVARDFTRVPHLAFGHGAHFCIGAGLARLVARVFFEELLRRHPDFALAGEPVRLRSTLINGFTELSLVFEGTRAA